MTKTQFIEFVGDNARRIREGELKSGWARHPPSLSAEGVRDAWEQESAGSNDTRWIQAALNHILGLRLIVDGVLGPATRGAIRTFQQRQWLRVDGVVGPNTRAAMRKRAPARPPRPTPRPPAPLPSGFVPVFHPGVEHNHAPTGRWGDVQSDSRTRCGGLIQKINVLDLLSDPAKLRMLPLADVNECACAFLSPEGVFRVAREVVMFDLPLARRHLDHYRSGKGRDLVVGLKDIVRADAKFRAKLGAQVKKRRSGHIRIEQSDYSVKDFVFALGAIDRLDFEVDRSAGVVHAWFKDRYEWHPVGFGYQRLLGDVRRPSNCVHAAMVELKSSGAADYWMIGTTVIPLSVF